MKKILTILAALLLPVISLGITPYYTTNSPWVTSNDLMQIQGSIMERAAVAQITYSPNPSVIPSNDVGFLANFGSSADNKIFELIPYFVAFTNLSDNYFENIDGASLPQWSTTNLYSYLGNNFRNIDNTVGVGVFVNNSWLLTQTWETNLTLCLGTLTYTKTGQIVTNGVINYICQWVYSDGDRIVARYSSLASSLPSEWRFYRNTRPGYWSKSILGGDYGLLFDYTDRTGMRCSIVTRPVATSLMDNITLKYQGLTNYNKSDTDYTTWITNSIDISSAINNTQDITEIIYDLGGYPDATLTSLGTFVGGLTITNINYQTNMDHVGDAIKFNLYIPNRTYQDPSLYSLYPAYGPWLDRKTMNERYAILSCLRVTQHSTPGSGYPYVGGWVWDNASISNSHFATDWRYDDWGMAKTATEAVYATNALTVISGAPHQWTRGTRDIFNALYGFVDSRFAYYLTARPIKTYDSRVSFYVISRAPYYFQPGWGISTTTFDNQGNTKISNTKYKYLSSTNAIAGGDAYSIVLGDRYLGVPHWCDEPGYGNDGYRGDIRGWEIEHSIYYQYWTGFTYATNSL